MRKQTVTVQVKDADGTCPRRPTTGTSPATAASRRSRARPRLEHHERLRVQRRQRRQPAAVRPVAGDGPRPHRPGPHRRPEADPGHPLGQHHRRRRPRQRVLHRPVGDAERHAREDRSTTASPGGCGAAAKPTRLYLLDGSRSDAAGRATPTRSARASSAATQLAGAQAHDYVQNSNDSHWLTNPASPLTGFSPIIGLERTEQGCARGSDSTSSPSAWPTRDGLRPEAASRSTR